MKTWLGPEAISKLRFASKSEVQTFIGPEYLPAHMGGTVRCCSLLEVLLILSSVIARLCEI